MANKKNHILVPVDFSAQSHIALDQALQLASATKASVTILAVMDKPMLGGIFSSATQAEKYRKSLQKKLDKMADDVLKLREVNIDTLVAQGKVYEEIVDSAKKLKSKFIVMGKSDENKFIGSNTMHVVRNAPCPVISIKGSVHRPYCKNILLPLDLTKETREKVFKAVEMAKYFKSNICVVAVQTHTDEYLVKKLKVVLKQVTDYIEAQGVSCTADMIQADHIAKAVLDYSKKIKADLIMIMTQQEREFTDFFIGSSAQQIINHSDTPVISLRPSGKEYEYSYSATGLYS